MVRRMAGTRDNGTRMNFRTGTGPSGSSVEAGYRFTSIRRVTGRRPAIHATTAPEIRTGGMSRFAGTSPAEAPSGYL